MEVLTLAEVMEILKVKSPSTVYALMARQNFPKSIERMKGRWLRDDILKWLSDQSTYAEPAESLEEAV